MQTKNLKFLKKRLLDLLLREAFKKGKFILSSGKVSNYYLDGRIITLSPEGAYLVASIILELIKGEKIDAIGGPTLGADPIVGAIACLSQIEHRPLKTFIVRKIAKEHGSKRQIEGPAIKNGAKVILVDDVATTGKSLIEAKQALEKKGIKVHKAIVIVDRNEGAKENLANVGLKLEPIFRDVSVFNRKSVPTNPCPRAGRGNIVGFADEY
jgi:orotate phosphoribosyltransferase